MKRLIFILLGAAALAALFAMSRPAPGAGASWVPANPFNNERRTGDIPTPPRFPGQSLGTGTYRTL